MAAGIIMAGYLYYLNYEREYRANLEHQLSSIEQLKVGELALWRKERLGNGALLLKNRAFSRLVRLFLENPEDLDAKNQLQEWMGKYTTTHLFAQVALLDAQGFLRILALEDGELVDLKISLNVATILREGRVVFQDFHRETPDDPIHLGIVVPIFDEADESRPLGVLLMEINPTAYLYPFISRWPTPSQTAETFLFRREGNDVLFLNEVKFQKNTALNLRIPLTKTDIPSVKATLGYRGVVEGMDYRGEAVIAAVGAVPDSPWYLVAKMNASEAYAPLKERMWQMAAVIGILLTSAGMAMGLIWKHRGARFYREQYKAAEALRETEESLRESDSFLRESQVIASLGSYALDIPTGLWKSSDVLDKVFGIGEAYERSVEGWSSLLHPDDRAMMLGYLRNEVIGNGQAFDKEYRIIRDDDKVERCVHEIGKLEFDAQGRPLKMKGTIQDITKRKRAESELRQAKEQAESATKLKDMFVEMVVHDLRSPVTSMMGLLRLFVEENALCQDKDCHNILDRVFKSGEKMLATIDDLLEISRLQTGQITPQPRFLKGHMAVADAIGSLTHHAAQKGIVIINEVPPDMRLYADPSLFGAVLLNLLSNAIKFCSSGDTIKFFTPPGLNSAIAVRDTGKGINEKIIPKLFRHEVATSTPGTAGEIGTGLGLPYCHDIMKAHGGELTGESAPGKGSVFCAILPDVKPVALVVDDDALARMALRTSLEKTGFDVIEAVDGEQALSATKGRPPHIIITDIMMPVMDGLTLLDRLKNDSSTREIPVIVMTANKGNAREKALTRGADDFVGKPVKMEEFILRALKFVG